jgi:hypothetical protein
MYRTGSVTYTFTFTRDEHIWLALKAFINIALKHRIADWRKWVDGCTQRTICAMTFQRSVEAFGGDELLGLHGRGMETSKK